MLWKKDYEVADWVTSFTVGNDYHWDNFLGPYDIRASLCHARGLKDIGILTPRELSDIETTLQTLLEAWEAGQINVRPEDEDCHTVIEHYLTDKLGDTGKKIHTGRSRNDQVLAALRGYVKDSIEFIATKTADLGILLCEHAQMNAGQPMPGFTHMQRAMPSSIASWACGYAEILAADLLALSSAYQQNNTSPLGSAAGYGVPYLDLPREKVAACLGFDTVQRHVTSVQLSRGKLELHTVHALVQLGATLNRMASDLVLYNTAEFNFVALPPEYCTGSSIMPQKQNPDVLELIRAYYHRLIAEMNLLLTLPANMPSGYHRDLQLTKEAIMKALHVSMDSVVAMHNIIAGMTWNQPSLDEAMTPELFATAVALEKVKDGVPFRDAYRMAAKEIDSWKALDLNKALDAYLTAGTPGNEIPDAIKQTIQDTMQAFR